MVLTKDKVISMLRMRGPSVPAELTSALGENTFIVGAFLSELVADKRVVITHAKIGGSPLYYVPEHKARITRLREHLHEKERTAFDMLMAKKVLVDDDLSPLLRTCMRNMKDFALPLQVKLKDKVVLFWQWFTVERAEAEPIVRSLLRVESPSAVSVPKPTIPSPPAQPQVSSSTQTDAVRQEISAVNSQLQQVANVDGEGAVVAETKSDDVFVKGVSKTEQKKTVLPKSSSVVQDRLEAFAVTEQMRADSLFSMVESYAKEHNVEFVSIQIVRANSELQGVVRVRTAIDVLPFYLKVRGKKNCSDKDVSSALLEAQQHQLPLLFITTGVCTKKTHTLRQDMFKNVLLVEHLG